jgi:hypothetical protein
MNRSEPIIMLTALAAGVYHTADPAGETVRARSLHEVNY